MGSTSFCLSYLPEEDRIALVFRRGAGKNPPTLLFTRKMVKLISANLRRYVENNISMPESMSREDKQSALKVLHRAELEANPPGTESSQEKDSGSDGLDSAQLVTRIDIRYGSEAVRLLLFNQRQQVAGLTLLRQDIHGFLDSLARMARKVDWELDETFDWVARALDAQDATGPI